MSTASIAESQQASESDASRSAPIATLWSRHTAGITFALSRYRRQWFLTYSRGYGMACGQRIWCLLNKPDPNISELHAKRHFWLNPNNANAPYDPNDPEYASQKFLCSPIHMLLDSENPVARLTGRVRAEKSRAHQEKPREIMCFEVEITISEEALLRQCWYCRVWETEYDTTRFKPCGDDAFWCQQCEARGRIASNFATAPQRLMNRNPVPSLYDSFNL